MWGKIVSYVTSLVSKVDWSSLWSSITSWASTAWGWIKSGSSTVWSWIVTMGSKTVSWIADKLGIETSTLKKWALAVIVVLLFGLCVWGYDTYQLHRVETTTDKYITDIEKHEDKVIKEIENIYNEATEKEEKIYDEVQKEIDNKSSDELLDAANDMLQKYRSEHRSNR